MRRTVERGQAAAFDLSNDYERHLAWFGVEMDAGQLERYREVVREREAKL